GIDLYQKAIDRDPHYALAYASMAYVLVMLPVTCDVPPSDVFPRARTAAKRALQLDDSLGDAHQSQGWVHFWCDYDWVNSEKEFRRTLDLDPRNSLGLWGWAHLLSCLGRHTEALALVQKGRELEPPSLVINALEPMYLFFAGKHEEGIQRLNEAFDIEP